MNYRILIAEDEPRLRNILCDYFTSRGDIPFPAQNGAEALDLSRLEAGKVRLASDLFSMLELTRQIFNKMSLLVKEKELTVHYDIAESFYLYADESRIGQVITNFATNAIKYSPQGGNIRLKIFQDQGKHHFSIENESEPLPEEALERIWDSFYRTETSRTSKGTGLGLAIAKSIIELHRGSCSASNTSTGVEFQFTLP